MTDDLNRLRAVTDEERYELGHPSPLGELVRQHQEKRSPARGVEACVCGRSVVGVPGWYLAHFASEMRAMVEANVAARTVALLDRLAVSDAETAARQAEVERLLVRAERAEAERDRLEAAYTSERLNHIEAFDQRNEFRDIAVSNHALYQSAEDDLRRLRESVTALADEFGYLPNAGTNGKEVADQLRALLADDPQRAKGGDRG